MVEVIGKSYTLTTLKNYCRLIGFFPYNLSKKGENVSVKFSLKYLAWSYFLGMSMLILGTTSVIYSFRSLSDWFKATFINEHLVIYIVHINFMFNIINAFFCINYTMFSRGHLNGFINNIMKVDKLLDQLDIPISKNRWSKPVAIVIAGVILIIVVVDSVSYYLIFERDLFVMHFLRKLPYFSSYFFTTAQTYMFWSLVLLVRARIRAIKDAVKDPDGINLQDFQTSVMLVKRSGKTDFKRLQNVYIRLFDAAISLDRLVRPIIVLSFATRFFALSTTPFILYVQLSRYRVNFLIISQTFWALAQFSCLALMVEPANCCSEEYGELKRELSGLLCHGRMFDVDLELLFDLVEALPIEFYINDATPLRRTLYVSILGSLTTYLVVLFQMSISY